MSDDNTNQNYNFSAKFREFYKNDLSKYFADLEKTRKVFLFWIVVVSIIALGLVTYIIYASNQGSLFVLYFFVLCGINLSVKAYKDKVKKKILPKLLRFVGDFRITEDKNVFEYIKTLKLFNEFNSQRCDDRIKGKYKLLDVDIAEIRLTKVTGMGKHRREVYVFSGLLIKVPCKKRYTGFTIIKYKGPQKLVKSFSLNPLSGLRISVNSGYSTQGDIVMLEDPEFNKLYEVRSSDQVEARYLITTAFMTRMINIANKGFGGSISVSFENGYVNLAVESNKDWFEVPILKPADEISNYKTIVLEIKELMKIIDSLKLEQNIGL